MESLPHADTKTTDSEYKLLKTSEKDHYSLNNAETYDMINQYHEDQLQDRVSECRNIIENLKKELHEEKNKMQNEALECEALSPYETYKLKSLSSCGLEPNAVSNSSSDSINSLPAHVDMKLGCDMNLLQYEKQLQKYQNTLSMAQKEKKNAIRNQMLVKAYKLKLLEVENQCNIELLRVKQSLQCLEPLHMIVDSWKVTNNDNVGVGDTGNMDVSLKHSDFSGVGESLKDDELKSFSDKVEDFAKDEILCLLNKS